MYTHSHIVYMRYKTKREKISKPCPRVQWNLLSASDTTNEWLFIHKHIHNHSHANT